MTSAPVPRAHDAGDRSPNDAEFGKILVVDDEPHIRRMLARYLERCGHQVETAGTVPEAVGMLAERRYDVVLTDLKLPGPSGLDLLVEIRARAPETRTIMISAHADVPSAATAIERGIDRLMVKPFELREVRESVRDSLQRLHASHRAARERRMLEKRLERRETESRMYILRATHSLRFAVEARDAYTAGHASRVTAYSLALAEVAGGIDLLRFRQAGELHDVGKIGVPDQVLNKPGRLTEKEFCMVKEHPAIGERILSPLIDDELVLGVVRSHHERWNGSGYPDGLVGHDIPRAARVLTVADTIDAMTSARAYRSALPWERAVQEIRDCAGSQFDPEVVEVFEEALPELEALHGHFLEQAEPGGADPGPDTPA